MRFNRLLEKLREYIKRDDYIDMIVDAYDYAKSKHNGQLRKSGEEFITHPLEVAIILSDLKIGPFSICAALLHDVLEDTDTSKQELEKRFNKEIANIVEGVTKLTKINFESEEDKLECNHRKILIAMSQDIRVVIVKLADRLHNMRTLKYMRPDKQISVSKETLDIYTPLAHRLGIQQLKSELEDIAIKYLDPSSFTSIKERLSMKQEQRKEIADEMTEEFNDILQNNEVAVVKVFSRVKNIYSIDKKMKNQNKTFDDIFDLLAIRVIVRDIAECYKVLGIVHSRWKPIPNRFKDYIAMPKPNMYQSLHTTIVGNGGKIFEVQIRTKEMDDIAEYGVAEHWKYKGTEVDELSGVNPNLRWYEDFKLKASQEDTTNFVGDVKADLFKANVYVFTPKGDVFDFPKGSTPIDFAFRIHTEIGSKVKTVIINGKECPLDYQLKTGDIIKINTSDEYSVNQNWLNFVQTSIAKNRIKTHFKKQDKELYYLKGKVEFTEILNAANLDIRFTDTIIAENYKSLNIKDEEELFIEIGKNKLDSHEVINKLYGIKIVEDDTLKDSIKGTNNICKTLGIRVSKIEKPYIKLEKCCCAIPGDEIVGFVNKKEDYLSVHRKECNSLDKISDENFIDVEWINTENIKYNISLEIILMNMQGVLSKIINSISNMGYHITSMNAFLTEKDTGKIRITLQVGNKKEVVKLINIMKTIREIKTVTRELL